MSPKTLPKRGGAARPPVDRPSYPTFFRVAILPGSIRDALEGEMKSPVQQLRARADVARIDAASLDELIAMSGPMRGYARHRLQERLLERPAALLDALDTLYGRGYPRTVDAETEAPLNFLLEPLADLGAEGGALLARHFERLPETTQILAAVVLGLTGQRQVAPQLYALAERLRPRWREEHIVGPLWGLVDLDDPRASWLLASMVQEHQILPETYGFLARVGDEEAMEVLVGHLSSLVRSGNQSQTKELFMAFAGIGHRLGTERSRALLEEYFEGAHEAEKLVAAFEEAIAARPPEMVRNFFELFFTGPNGDVP